MGKTNWPIFNTCQFSCCLLIRFLAFWWRPLIVPSCPPSLTADTSYWVELFFFHLPLGDIGPECPPLWIWSFENMRTRKTRKGMRRPCNSQMSINLILESMGRALAMLPYSVYLKSRIVISWKSNTIGSISKAYFRGIASNQILRDKIGKKSMTAC